MDDDPGNRSGDAGRFRGCQFFPAEKVGHPRPHSQRRQGTGQVFPSGSRRPGGVDGEIIALPTPPPPVGLEDSVRIEEVGNRQIEFGEVIAPIGLKDASLGEKSRQSRTVNGPDLVHPTRSGDQLAETGIGHQFEPGLWPLLPDPRHRRQREQKIPERAATDDQDFQNRRIGFLVGEDAQPEQAEGKAHAEKEEQFSPEGIGKDPADGVAQEIG